MRRSDAIRYIAKPDHRNTVELIAGLNSDIIQVIHSNLPRAARQCAEFAWKFKADSEYKTCKNIWDFLKREIRYRVDKEGQQDIKLPGRFVAEGTGDCKSFSLFTAAILQNLNIPFSFRYTSYGIDPTPQHVYIVTGSGIIIDGVWNAFNAEKKYTHKKDYPMRISTLSGIGCQGCQSNRLAGTVMIGDVGSLKSIVKGAGKSIKKAASNVQDAAKKTGIVKKAATLQNKVKDTGLVKAGSRLQDQIKKGGFKSVALAAPRRAYRTLLAINFRGWATRLASNSTEARNIWTKSGGDWSELERSINVGKGKKALFGSNEQRVEQVSGIGSAVLVTIGSLLALAAPIIAIYKSLHKDEGGSNTSSDLMAPGGEGTPGTDAPPTDSGSPLDAFSDLLTTVSNIFTGNKTDKAPPQAQSSPGSETPPESGKSNTLLYLALAGAGAYLIFKK